MAGISALSEGLDNGQWYLCSDGSLIEPLDYLNLLFPNKGRSVVGDNVCFEPRPFSVPLLQERLPDGDNFYLPDHLIDGVISLTLLTVLVTILMIVMKWVWSRLDPQFAAITPAHKQWYVVANMCKATALAILTLSTRFWVGTYRAFFLDQFVNLEIKRCAMIYIATDVAALYMVPKLPQSTIMHHVATTGLSLMCCGINLTLKGWTSLLGTAKMALIYGIFSTPNFSVNAYLGLRIVYPNAKWGGLVTLSMCVYLLCCAMNWSSHAWWLAGLAWNGDLSIYCIIYLLPISAMVRDDIVLLKWLWKRGSPLVDDEGDEGKSQNRSSNKPNGTVE